MFNRRCRKCCCMNNMNFNNHNNSHDCESDIIETSLRKILQGNLDDVVNHDISLGIPDKSIENDIFWDVNSWNIRPVMKEEKRNFFEIVYD